MNNSDNRNAEKGHPDETERSLTGSAGSNAAGIDVVKGWGRVVAGLFVFAFGVHLTIFANIGLAAWDCLGMGISYHTPMNYGISMTVMALIILVIDVLMGEKIGFGTVLDAVLTGNFVQFFNDLNPLAENRSLALGVLSILTGLAFMAVGQWIYMRAAQGCGPRDALLIALGKRLPSVPIGFVQVGLWAVVLLAGWLLGGPIGPGTIIGTFGAGIVMQIIYSLIGFEPRDIRHRNIAESASELFQKSSV